MLCPRADGAVDVLGDAVGGAVLVVADGALDLDIEEIEHRGGGAHEGQKLLNGVAALEE